MSDFTVVTDAQGDGFVARIEINGQEPLTYAVSADHPLYKDFAIAGFTGKLKALVSAGTKKDVPFDSATAQEKVLTQLEQFSAGKWNIIRNGEGQVVEGILVKALVYLSNEKGTPKTAVEVQAYLESLESNLNARKSLYAAIRSRPDVIRAIAAVKCAAGGPAKAAVDLSALGL